jgi:hypothetical protein
MLGWRAGMGFGGGYVGGLAYRPEKMVVSGAAIV